MYGHIAREGEYVWLQYWLFFAYNPQDRGIVRTGRHEGDWELAQFRLGAAGAVELATLSQHSWAEGCGWEELERREVRDRETAVLFVANGSHALYSRPGSHDRPFPDPDDEADGDGRVVRQPVTVVTDDSPAWVRYPGRWGETEAGWVPGESPSPRGPKFQDHGAWRAPSSFHTQEARACGTGAPGHWREPILAAGAALLVAAAVWLPLRRMRRRR